jgi:hypothetical protein
VQPLDVAIDAIASETGFSGIVHIANTSEGAWPAPSRLAELLGMDG